VIEWEYIQVGMAAAWSLLEEPLLSHVVVMCCTGRMLSPHGKVHGKATESTVEILYQLGTHQDDGLRTRYDIIEQHYVSTLLV